MDLVSLNRLFLHYKVLTGSEWGCLLQCGNFRALGPAPSSLKCFSSEHISAWAWALNLHKENSQHLGFGETDK